MWPSEEMMPRATRVAHEIHQLWVKKKEAFRLQQLCVLTLAAVRLKSKHAVKQFVCHLSKYLYWSSKLFLPIYSYVVSNCLHGNKMCQAPP